MEKDELIRVEIAYGTIDDQALISLHVPKGTTVIEAILLSAIAEQFPEVDFEGAAKGVFSKLTENGSVLKDKDRVEVYRPLVADPREARRQRAKQTSKR